MNFKVKYSIERDMYNYLNAIWKMQYRSFGRDNLRKRLLSNFPEGFQRDIKEAKTEEDARKVITKFLMNRLTKNKLQFEKRVKNIQETLDKNKDKIIKKLE